MGIITWIIFGGLAGWIASKIMGTDAQQGILLNVVVGIIGAFVGGFVANLLGIGSNFADFNIGSFIIAVIGACILLFAMSFLTGRRRV